MGLFRKRVLRRSDGLVPRLPLTIPTPERIPLPDLDTMRHYMHETLAFGDVAMKHAQSEELRRQAAPLVTALFVRFGSHLTQEDEQEWLTKALSAAVRLGMGYAKVEADLGLVGSDNTIDGRVHNALVTTTSAFEKMPSELRPTMFYCVLAGHYFGRTGDLEAVLENSI